MVGQYLPCENTVCSCAQEMPSCIYLDGKFVSPPLAWGSLMAPFPFTVQAQEPFFSPMEAAVLLYLLMVAVFRPLFPLGYWEFHRETTMLAQCRRGAEDLPVQSLPASYKQSQSGEGKVPCPQFLRGWKARRSSMETSPVPDCC